MIRKWWLLSLQTASFTADLGLVSSFLGWFWARFMNTFCCIFYQQLATLGCTLLCVHLWQKVKAFYWGHEVCTYLLLMEVSRPFVSQKRPVPCYVCACSLLCVHWWRPDNAREPIPHQNGTKRDSRASDAERLSALITFKFSAKFADR